MDDQIDEYLYQLTEVVNAVLHDRMVGLYLSGSAVLDDFNKHVSDIDVLCVVKRPLKAVEKQALVQGLSDNALPSPGVGLEFYVVVEKEAAHPHSLPSYEFALLTGQTFTDKVEEEGVDEGLLMDFALILQSGRTLTGRPKEDVFGKIPKPWLHEAMNGSLRWHEKHIFHPFYDPYGHEAVLNACRSWCFKETGVLTSKTKAATWALQLFPDADVIRHALAIRHGQRHDLVNVEEIQPFLRYVISKNLSKIPSVI
ncbi:aminoglycoside adenylyltransferase domain-containing protein [Natribacillus halophilus]|nr:aminoglycoside adenylyltransferase domain-containing protein [Natribacillus halophilus]